MEQAEQNNPPQPPTPPETKARAEAPQEQIASLKDASKTLNSFGVIIFIVIVVEVVLLFGLNLYQNARVNSLDNELADLRTKLSSSEYKSLNTQVEQVISGTEKLQVVLASKVKWSDFYTKLGAVTPKNVKLSSINISSDGSFKADGETLSMTSLAEALVAWNEGLATATTPFNTVKLNSNGFIAKDGQRKVTFTVSGQINLGRLR